VYFAYGTNHSLKAHEWNVAKPPRTVTNTHMQKLLQFAAACSERCEKKASPPLQTARMHARHLRPPKMARMSALVSFDVEMRPPPPPPPPPPPNRAADAALPMPPPLPLPGAPEGPRPPPKP
jgi:hypothetical protein